MDYKERDEVMRAEFKKEIQNIAPSQLVFADEAGINNNEVYQHGWAPRGQRLNMLKPGCRTQRISIIGALNQGKLIAPLFFEGYTNQEVFITYLESVLVPQLKPGQYLILDNAAFHKNPKVRKIIETAGCFLKYLPPYSPDLNPIEHYWHSLKNTLRKELAKCDFNLMQAATNAFEKMGQA